MMGGVADMPVPLAKPRVLVIEDDPHVSEVVGRYLGREGFEVRVEVDGAAGLAEAMRSPPDVIVLDVMLPSMSGLEVCRRLRASLAVPVIMLTALGDEVDRITGLEIGADDYLAKPFSPRELTARVKAVLRRARGEVVAGRPQTPVLKSGELTLDPVAHECRVGPELVMLTAKEFDLLAHFMRHPRQAFRREDLLEAVWGYGYGDTSTVTVHVRRLREKVETDPSDPKHIRTVWGVGYRFEPSGAAP
jgi:DNA-binding response OmpR family regulator